MKGAAPVAAAVLLALAGCLGTDPGTMPSNDPVTPGDEVACRVDCNEPNSTGVAAPSWSEGQWWEWTVTSGEWQFSVKTVVAFADGNGARFGSTELEQGLWAGWFHLPPIGHVQARSLAWEAHDEPMALLQFPLTDGMTWASTLEGDEIQLTSTRTGESTYRINGAYTNDRPAVRAVYDAKAEMYSSIDLLYGGSEPWSSAVLTSYGHNDTTDVHITYSDDLVVRGASTPSQPAVADSFTIDTEADYLVVGCETIGGPGVFEVILQSPAREQFTCTGGGGIFLHEHSVLDIVVIPAVAGQWTYELVGTAEGFIFTEIMAVVVES